VLCQTIVGLQQKSKERSFLLEKIRNLGDYQHNYKSLEKGEGQIIPWRNPPYAVSVLEYVPCPCCFAFFLKKDLWRHRKVCRFQNKNSGRNIYKKVSVAAQSLLPMPKEASTGVFKNVLCKMVQDQTTLIARNDSIIVQVGCRKYMKHGHLPHMHNVISQNMRELSRLLQVVREKDSTITTIEDCLNQSVFRTLVASVKELCGWSDINNNFVIPSLALKLGIP